MNANIKTSPSASSEQAAGLHMRQEAAVEISDADQDNFTKNLVTIRTETHVGLAVYIPAGVQAGALTT